MSTLTEVRAAVVARLTTVANIGQVHDRERFARDEKVLRQLYETAGKILGWNVRRVSKLEMLTNLGRVIEINTWRISGYQSFSDADASEIAFDNLTTDIAAAFRADETLGGVISSTVLESGESGIQVEDSGPVMFAGVLCHAARLKLNTIHYI